MPISSYPRRGHAIAPQALRAILDAPIPSGLRPKLRGKSRLCDLDASVWKSMTDFEAGHFGDAVVKEVSASLREGLAKLPNDCLPMPPIGSTLEDLELEVRSFNCIRNQWPECEYDLQSLGHKTIGQVMKLHGFGSKCLVDLLSSLEELQDAEPDTPAPDKNFLHTKYLQAYGGKEIFQDERIRLLLDKIENASDEMRERMHRVAWLLCSGYDANVGAEEMTKIWNALDNMMQSASQLEALAAQTESGQSLIPQLDQQLSHLAQTIATIPNLSDIQCNDVRLSPLLNELLTDDETLQVAIQRLLTRKRDPIDSKATRQQLDKLSESLAILAHQTVEAELQSIFESLAHHWRASERTMEVLAWRYGFDGNGGHTLEECGLHFKVSRERIRQITKPAEDEVKSRTAWTPALDRALEWLETQTPLPLDEVGPKLKDEGIVCSKLSMRTLKRIATLFQRDVPFQIEVVGETSFVQSISAQEGNDVATQILSYARRQISRWGVATIDDIAASVNEKYTESVERDLEGTDDKTFGASIHPSLVERVLSAQSDFVLLDAVAGWFWLSSVTRNGLVSEIEKVLAVAPRVRIADLRVGISRHHRRQGFAPPQRVLLELCRQLPNLDVEGDSTFVHSAHKLDWALSPTEQVMADVLREHGPVMTRAELERQCSAAHIPRGTFYTYLKHSPIIEKYARSVYGLRGACVEPGFIESLEPEWAKRRTRVLKDYGWTAEGKAWFSYKLSEGMLANGVCSVPSAMRRFVQGEYSLWTVDGSYVDKWTCGDNQAWGVGSFLRRRGGEPGDILLLLIDVAAHKVLAEIGDETLLEEYDGTGVTTS